MFCQPDIITNKIFAFFNASTDWSKTNCCYRKNFNLMRLQYSLIGSVQHSGPTHSIMLCLQKSLKKTKYLKGTLMQI